MSQDAYIVELEEALGLVFKDKRLLLRALTHRSYLNEHREERWLGDNERLEFLGDAVLELVVTEYLYRTLDPMTPEGRLTNIRAELVNTTSLTQVALQLKLPRFLRMARGQRQEEEQSDYFRTRLSANAVEAILGALYLDRGKASAEIFVLETIIPKLEGVLRNGTSDWKSQLQELVQRCEGVTPRYRVINEEGPDHSKRFVVQVMADRRVLGMGTGSNKKLAQTDAAIDALSKYGK